MRSTILLSLRLTGILDLGFAPPSQAPRLPRKQDPAGQAVSQAVSQAGRALVGSGADPEFAAGRADPGLATGQPEHKLGHIGAPEPGDAAAWCGANGAGAHPAPVPGLCHMPGLGSDVCVASHHGVDRGTAIHG